MARPVAAERTRPAVDRRTWWIDAAVLAAIAVLLRIPAFVASRHLTYDDGFFGLSAIEMRDGVVPFRDLFSPQGPLHLPLLYIADLVGLRTTNAPRVLPLVAGAAVTVVTYAAARRITSRYGAIVAAVLVTTSGSILWTTAGIASDGPALAFAIGAVAVSFGYTQTPKSSRAVAAGALLGAALVAKALAAPAGLVVAVLLLSRRRPRDLAYAVGAAVVVALGAALPWGLQRVWDQSVVYNREASRLTSYPGAVTKALHTLVDRDPIVLVAAALAVAMLVLARIGWVRAARTDSPADGPLLFRPASVLVLWLVVQFALLVYEPAFWRPHVAFLIAPLALLVALRPPPLVALLDISGSMSEYTRLFLHFLHAITNARKRVTTLLFGTRLTNVSRAIRQRDPDEALAACSANVADWSGGTRIASSLHVFNKQWARRVLTQGAVVLLITDGLERDADDTLAFEMDRLHRSCRRLIWLNPLLRFSGFEARAKGVQTMLPYVDELRPIHNLESMAELVRALSGAPAKGYDPKLMLRRVA